MGRSQETFGKKENEKKRKKKKEDKEQRKEDRQSNSSKGMGLDHMMAYVDEEGNISSTPPDPKRKKQIIQDNIQIAIPKQEKLPTDNIKTGTLINFNFAKGYGFIRDQITQESIFVHQSAMQGQINEKDIVSFEVERGVKGFSAINVKLKENLKPWCHQVVDGGHLVKDFVNKPEKAQFTCKECNASNKN